jgi:hypothetical protein
LLVLGRYSNGALASGGGIVVWPSRPDAHLAGRLELNLRAPDSGRLRLTIGKRVVNALPGAHIHLRIPVCKRSGLWSIKFDTAVSGSVGSVLANVPRYTTDRSACIGR